MLILTVLEIFSVDVISNPRTKQNYSGVWRRSLENLQTVEAEVINPALEPLNMTLFGI